MNSLAFACLSQFTVVSGHGMITFPPSRPGGNLTVAAANHFCGETPTPGGRGRGMCSFYSHGEEIPSAPTIPYDSALVTIGCAGKNRTIDCTATHPWRAPGSAPVISPCGVSGGGPGRDGDMTDGRDLLPVPEAERAVWKIGTVVEVGWAIFANHRGGYSWRLCPAGEDLTEECFQRHPLDLLGSQTTVLFTNGTRQAVSTMRTSEGTTPKSSQWTRNPVPRASDGPGFPFPIDGLQSDFCDYSLVDKLLVPDVSPGSWVLGWRWDCEESPQVWQGCADITIVAPEVSI